MTTGENPNPFDIETFAVEIELAASSQEIITAGVQATPAMWAVKGRPAVTSLLAEGFLSVDRMPKEQSETYLPYHLSQAGRLAIASLDAIITLNPNFYDADQCNAVQANRWDFRRGGITSEEYKKLPRAAQEKGAVNFLSDPRFSRYFAEYGLGLLNRNVRDGLRDANAGFQNGITTDERASANQAIVQKMVLNGSVDADITLGLADLRKEGKHTEEEFFGGVLELARQTSIAVTQNASRAKKHTTLPVRFRRALRRRI